MQKQGFYNRIFLLIVALQLVIPQIAKSQQSLSASYNYGKILIHSPAIEPLIKGPSHGFTITYAVPNSWGEQWRLFYNFPNYGFTFNYKSYGNPDVLGDSYSMTSFLQLSFLKKHRVFDLGFKGFAGFGYFTKTYDAEINPSNKAISAHLNISAEARLYTKVRIEPFYFEYSYGLNHFSNGLIKAPNLGINLLNNNFALGYEFEGQLKKDKAALPEKPKLIKNEFWGFVSTGFKEVDGQDKKYMFSSFSVNYSKQISVINKMGLGIDFLNDPSLTSLAYQEYHYLGESDLDFRYGINFHNEFMMGPTGLFMAYGFYFRESEYYVSRGYYKAGFKFYFRDFFGIALIRAIPLFRADVVEFGIGYRIK